MWRLGTLGHQGAPTIGSQHLDEDGPHGCQIPVIQP